MSHQTRSSSQIKAAEVEHNAPMAGHSTIVLGIEIPSTDPIFIAVIVGIHIPLGLACVGAGAVAMLARNAGPLFGGPRLLAVGISGLIPAARG